MSSVVTSSAPLQRRAKQSLPQLQEYVMNTRDSKIGHTSEQAESGDSRYGQMPCVMDLGAVTEETGNDAFPVVIDSFPHLGSMGG
jgi:hypothetical protein